jgi:hypothetical protein
LFSDCGSLTSLRPDNGEDGEPDEDVTEGVDSLVLLQFGLCGKPQRKLTGTAARRSGGLLSAETAVFFFYGRGVTVSLDEVGDEGCFGVPGGVLRAFGADVTQVTK